MLLIGALGFAWDIVRIANEYVPLFPGRKSGKKGRKRQPAARQAVDTLVTWLYRRSNWHGLSIDGRYRESAPEFYAKEFYRDLGLDWPYEPPANVQAERGYEGPPSVAVPAAVHAQAGPASGLGVTDVPSIRVTPGPGSPTLDQVSYATDNRRHNAYELGFSPKAIRLSKPEDRLLRAADLPFEMASGSGEVVVEKFYADGVVIDEVNTSGQPVAFVAYRD